MADQSIGTASTSSSLIRRVKARDTGAWQRLVQLYTPMVYGWARRGGLNDSDAADVSQEVFQTLVAKIDQFQRDQTGTSFRGWLWKITQNQVRLHFRKRTNEPDGVGGTDAAMQFQQLPDFFESAEEPSAEAARTQLVHRTLRLIRNDFSQQVWDLFWRQAVEGESAADIASELEIPAKNIRQAKYRVLCRLREELEGS